MKKLLTFLAALLLAVPAMAQTLPSPVFVPSWNNGGKLPLLTNNLSDIPSIVSARANLGLGALAILNAPPPPGVSTLGGIAALTCSTNQFVNGVDTSGNPTCATPTTGSSTAAAGSSGQFQTNSSGSLAGVTVSGDVAISGTTGAATISNNAVTTSKILDANVTTAKLASGAAAANLGFTPSRVFNAMDYGCAWNGTTDDTTCVNNAVTAANAAGGGKVVLPSGNGKLCQITLKDNVWVEGQGVGTNILACNATTNVFSASSTVIRNIRINNLQISSSTNGVSKQSAGAMVAFNNCDTCYIDHVVFRMAFTGILATGDTTGGGAGASVDVIADHLSMFSTANIGIDFINCTDCKIDTTLMRGDVSPNNAVAGIRMVQTGGNWISNSDLVGQGVGLQLSPGAGQEVKWLMITNSALGDSNTEAGGVGIYIVPSGTGARVGSLIMQNVWSSSSRLGGIITACGTGGSVDNIELHGVHAVANGGPGVWFQCGTNLKVLGGIMQNNSNASIGGTSGTAAGIQVEANVSHFTVRDVTCSTEYPTSSFPVSEVACVWIKAGTSDYYTINGVDGVGYSTSGNTVIDSGTGTHKNVSGNF